MNNTFCIGGTVVRSSYSSGGKGSYFSVPHLSGLASADGAVIITGITPAAKESVAMLLALDSTKHIVTFGSDFEAVEITGLGIIGNQIRQRANVEGSIESWYSANRVSKLKAPVFVGKGSVSYAVFVLGLNMGKPDQMNTVPFTISCVKATASPSK